MGRSANQDGNDSAQFTVTANDRMAFIGTLRALRARWVPSPNSVPAKLAPAHDGMRYSARFPGL